MAVQFWLPLTSWASDASTITLNSSVAANSVVAYNTQVTLTGKIQPDPANPATVYLQSKRKGQNQFRNLASTKTDAEGNYSIAFNSGASGYYRVSWSGNANLSGSTSAPITINVRPILTLGRRVPNPTWAGQQFYVLGNLTPRHPRGQVSIQIATKTGWKTIARGKADKNSNFKIQIAVGTIGNHRLRIAFRDVDHSLATSRRFRIRLRWANPWRISPAHRHYIVINKRTFKLWYLRNGRIVRTFRAGVGTRSYPTPSGNWRIVRKAVRPTWYRPSSAWARNMPPSIAWPRTPLGARGLYLNVSGIIIHGTTQPWLLDRPNRAVSHGCIRLKNDWVIWLYNRAPAGTNVKIYG